MKAQPPKLTHRLSIQTGGLFNCPYEWAITDFVYWKSNTQFDRQWTCRMRLIQQYTPAKRIETITNALDRLCERGMGFSKIPFGKPQRRRCGSGLTAEPQQAYQYIFDAKVFDAWLKSQPKPPIRKRIDPYPKADSQLSENGQQSYPKADTTIRNKKEEKKEIEEAMPVRSQPPSTAAAAPERNLADVFEDYFKDTETSQAIPAVDSKAAEGGGAVGVLSTSGASPSTSIQPAYGKSNEVGRRDTQGLPAVGSQPPSTAAAAPEPHRDLAEEFERLFDGMPLASTCSGSPSGGPQPAEGEPNDGQGCPRAALIQPSADGTMNASARPGNVPKAVADHAELVLHRMRKGGFYTQPSIDVVERELWKELSAQNWEQVFGWSDPVQVVTHLRTKLVAKFGQYA